MSTLEISSASPTQAPAWTAWSVLALLSCAVVLGYLDRQILALLIEPVKQTFALSDFKVGALHGVAMSLCYALASIPMGRLIDSRNRRNLMIACILSWSAATVFCGLADSYGQLFVARMVVGIAEAGLFPAAYSLMADMFEPRRRATANLVYYALGLLGSSGALALGGFAEGLISRHHDDIPGWLGTLEPWRLTFIGVGVPGLLLAAMFLLFREPMRVGVAVTATRLIEPPKQFVLRHRRTYGWLYVVVFGTGLAVSTVVTWTATVLVRLYEFKVGDAGIAVGTAVCVGSVGGVLLSGLWNRARARQPCDGQMFDIIALSNAGAILVLLGMAMSGSARALQLSMGAFMLVLFLGFALIPTLVVSISPPGTSGRFMAVYVLSGMTADAIQAVVVGALSDLVFRGPGGLLHAMVAVALSGGAIGMLALLRMRASFRVTAAELESRRPGI